MKALERDPKLVGRLIVSFVINSQGRVKSSAVQTTTIRDRLIGECVAGIVRGWSFPLFKGRRDFLVNYPFLFTAGGPDPEASHLVSESVD